MAMASNPNRNNREIDESQRSRPSSRRVDPAHGSSNVPVLFRLKNLQRTEAAAPVDAAQAGHASSSDAQSARLAASNLNSAAKINNAPPPNVAPSSAAASNVAPPTNPGTSNKASPSDSPKVSGKLGVSNGFILLAGLVAVAFAIGRNTNKPPQVASATPASKATSAALPQDTSSVAASPTTVAVAPLAPPALPEIPSDTPASDSEQATTMPKAPLLVSVENGKESKGDQESAATPSSVDVSRDATVSLESKAQEPANQNDNLPVPSMLVTAKKELSHAEEPLTFGKDSTSEDDSTTIPSIKVASTPNDSTSNSATSHSATSSPTSATNETTKLSIGPDSNESPKPVRETTSEKAAAPTGTSKVVMTSVPDMDTAQLYEMRANFQSQMDALAKARQGQSQQPFMTTSAPQPNLQQHVQATLDQSMAVGQQAMAVGQQAMASAGQQAMSFGQQAMTALQTAQPNMNIAPPLPGYGQPQPNQPYFGQPTAATANPPRAQYTPPAPSVPGTQYPSPTQQGPGSPYSPIGRQASYPAANTQTSPQTPVQAYQPLFATPPANPMQGYGQPTMQQGTASPYPNSAPSFQTN